MVGLPDNGVGEDTKSLNTLSGGHPLGGSRRQSLARRPSQVSIPSQVGILLVAEMSKLSPSYCEVSIPSQVGILLVVKVCGRIRRPGVGLNTLSGGHPLGGSDLCEFAEMDDCGSQYPLRWASSWWEPDSRRAELLRAAVSIPSQVGILLVDSISKAKAAGDVSQYPLRWASSWWRRRPR